MQFAQSRDGTLISFTTAGKGPPLLIVHGALNERTRWNEVAELLEPFYTVSVMDRRGRGESGDGSLHSLEVEAEDVAAVLDTYRAPIDVLAHSFGALAALEASALTKNVRRLVLYEPHIYSGPPADLPTGALDTIDSLVASGDRQSALHNFFRDIFAMPETEIAKLLDLPYWDERIAVIHTAPREIRAVRAYRFDPTRFANLATPTLLMLGSDSPPFFRETAGLLEAGLPDTRVAMLHGQQHNAMATGPQILVDALRTFLEKPISSPVAAEAPSISPMWG